MQNASAEWGMQNRENIETQMMLYRIVDNMAIVDNIFHELQDYENKLD